MDLMAAADLGMSLLSKLLSDFYRKSHAYFPDHIEEREFGVGDLVRKIVLKANDETELKRLFEAFKYKGVPCALVEMGIRNGNWDMVYIKNKADFWKSVIEKQAVAQSDRIDKNVTNDTGHMIRLASHTIRKECW